MTIILPLPFKRDYVVSVVEYESDFLSRSPPALLITTAGGSIVDATTRFVWHLLQGIPDAEGLGSSRP